jgi:two-component system sensor kinase
VHEALANSARHANARRAWVQLGQDDGVLRLSIYDDGVATTTASREGLGLLGIRERARLLDGQADVTVSPDKGLRVEVTIPL